MDCDKETIVRSVRASVNERMSKASQVESSQDETSRQFGSAGHGFDHIERVVRSALQIQSKTGGDAFVIELAALLHDLGDAKFHDGVERSGEFARQILVERGVAIDVVEHVVEIVDNISFRKRAAAAPLSLEGRIVQDADRLDALGAIGIVRTIEYGAFVGQPFHSSDPNTKTGIDHFHEKLFKLVDLLNTEEAKRMAASREDFMRSFLEQYLTEIAFSTEPQT